ncbi:MAG: succinate dehydrogenase, hydrophobic membrane anchor protein [Alphaproteobacteria bacterium]|nr:succinate dehydrogenase, hydrophobic membrane anchor protein [Alphaproteobacteria bacterium]MBU0796439.1 succinate dehydrogenase, hydrophobic membrane anchor protein [Alphaproteobacteria bacterium]MBU0888675.1 succinate dehydrogenase, hydrophobic membrane anchor protein [Alphaproteobacteria bacterium]MBU1813591.1 succinate dehydrogenase, hydrophobic membrane anchor protein [Alphaproteobacteria bacterium]MBU2091510.1 succinate dehydrogenase, hydrophobic membrane anchor protein [Alphaproteobac
MGMQSNLGRVRGMGSAKDGVHHWWMQRLTAVALVPLLLWLVISIIAHAGAGHEAVSAWMGQPVPAILMILLIIAGFYHAQLGVQVVIEDYVHNEGVKFAILIGLKLLTVLLGVASVFAISKLAFGA